MTDLELREAVALEVMNLGPNLSKWRVHGTVYDKEELARSVASDKLQVTELKEYRKSYETDIAAAWGVVEVMIKKGFILGLDWDIGAEEWAISWANEDYSIYIEATFKNVSNGICSTALDAVRQIPLREATEREYAERRVEWEREELKRLKEKYENE